MTARVSVLLPRTLAAIAGGSPRLDVEIPEPATLGAVLGVLATRHPALARRLRDERAQLRRYVNFFINGEECRYRGGADAVLREGDEIQVIPSIAGG